MRLATALCGGAVLLLGVGCYDFDKDVANYCEAPCDAGTPDFALSLSPAAISLQQGGSAQVTVTATATRGFTGTLVLTLASPPTGISSAPASVTVADAGPASAMVTVSASATAPAGSGSLTLQASNGTLSHTAPLGYDVTLAQVGSLTIDLNTNGASITPTVQIAGPNAYSNQVTATTTLVVPVGTYAVSAPTVRPPANGALISTLYDPTISPPSVTVTAGGTMSSAVSYAPRGGTGHLWVLDEATSAVGGFLSSQLMASGTQPADIGIGTQRCGGTIGGPYQMIFDPSGDLWLSCPYVGQLEEFQPAQLANTGSPAPYAFIPDSGWPASTASTFAFDPTGDLWVVQQGVAAGDSSFVRYDAAQLKGDGGLEWRPSAVLFPMDPNQLQNPHGLAFDATGDMYVLSTDYGAYNAVLHVSQVQQALSGQQTIQPQTLTASVLQIPVGLAIDSAGDFWVVNFSGANVTEFTQTQVQKAVRDGGGDLGTPRMSFTSADIPSPDIPAFDEHGNLWFSNTSERTVVEFAGSTLVGQGTGQVLSAQVVVRGTDAGPSPQGRYYLGVALDPAPASLPLP